MSIRLFTGVSKAFWCTSKGEFNPAEIDRLQNWPEGPKEVCWLDKLFEGGIFLPKQSKKNKRALTILLTGPPGSGKSTMALELCYRWTDTIIRKKKNDSKRFFLSPSGFSSLYITSETDPSWALQKAKSFGWGSIVERPIADRIVVDSGKKEQDKKIIKILGTTDFQNFLDDETEDVGVTSALIGALANLFSANRSITDSLTENLSRRLNDIWERELRERQVREHEPDILVIDSLNTLEPSRRPEVFKRFMKLVNSGPKIILMVIESNQEGKGSTFWEYSADIVIRLDKKTISDYLVRTIEILKARYQSHVWGAHQLKIYTPSKLSASNKLLIRKRLHPFRKEGGIFIYPSIHYYLSGYKRSGPSGDITGFPVPLRSMEKVLKEGFPRGRCTGFIGIRGGHKSHLGYLSVLKRIVDEKNQNERALIVSLRDDEEMARRTLAKILKQETTYKYGLSKLEEEDRLEILYYPPGYVTPEEFFHRMMLSVHRLKSQGNGTSVTVLFNSLDQLSSRFPLCAREQIFIPGIIESLSAEDVTSIFIAVSEPGQPPEQYGLLSMADALISFDQKLFSRDDYLDHVINYLNPKPNDSRLDISKKGLPEKQKIIVMRVVRFAGGQAAGSGGLLELIHKGTVKNFLFNERLCKYADCKDGEKEGLVFIPFQK